MAVTLPFRRIEPFGVEIDFDLSQPLAPSLAYHFGELLREHAVLVGADQALSEEVLRGLCAMRPGTLAQAVPGGTIRFTREDGDVLERAWRAGDVVFWDEAQVRR